jgi:hypothetical protein
VSTRLREPTSRPGLHVAQAAVHLLEPLGHLLEALAQALLERGVELLVDGGAHLLELGGVVLLDGRQALLDALAQLGQAQVEQLLLAVQRGVERLARRVLALRQLLLQRGQLHAEGIDLLVLRARHVAALGQQRALELAELRQQLLAQRRRLGALVALQALQGIGGEGGCGAAQQQHHEQDQRQHQQQQGQKLRPGHGGIVDCAQSGPDACAFARPSHPAHGPADDGSRHGPAERLR